MLDPELVYAVFPGIPDGFRRAMLTEYLQCKALGYMYGSILSKGLVFMGGTALRIFYGTRRFSEDLDFDLSDVSFQRFTELMESVGKEFGLEGLDCDVSVKRSGAFSGILRFTGILQKWELTAHRDEVLRLKIDGESQNYSYSPEIRILNRFDVTATVPVAPDSLLLAQKLHAILERNRVMTRDLYDSVYLFGRTEPDMRYLLLKQGTDDRLVIAERINGKLAEHDIHRLASNLAPFLPDRNEVRKVELFPEVLTYWADGAGENP